MIRGVTEPMYSPICRRKRSASGTERRIERHGIRKTTMEDVASEVDMSRSGVYCYFSERDELLIEPITRHGRMLRDRAHKVTSRQSGLADQIVE